MGQTYVPKVKIYRNNDGTIFEETSKNVNGETTGTMTYIDGRKINGIWKNGLLVDGYYTINYRDGRVYKGFLKKGLKDGKGELFLPDGSRLSCTWENDMVNGKGSFYHLNGREEKVEYKNNKLVTESNLKQESKNKIEKEVYEKNESIKSNECVIKEPDSVNEYDSKVNISEKNCSVKKDISFKMSPKEIDLVSIKPQNSKILKTCAEYIFGNLPDKPGDKTIKYANGDKYTGQVKKVSGLENPLREGKGKTTYANGDIHIGLYKDDKRHGEGRFICKKNGNYLRGEFCHDMMPTSFELYNKEINLNLDILADEVSGVHSKTLFKIRKVETKGGKTISAITNCDNGYSERGVWDGYVGGKVDYFVDEYNNIFKDVELTELDLIKNEHIIVYPFYGKPYARKNTMSKNISELFKDNFIGYELEEEGERKRFLCYKNVILLREKNKDGTLDKDLEKESNKCKEKLTSLYKKFFVHSKEFNSFFLEKAKLQDVFSNNTKILNSFGENKEISMEEILNFMKNNIINSDSIMEEEYFASLLKLLQCVSFNKISIDVKEKIEFFKEIDEILFNKNFCIFVENGILKDLDKPISKKLAEEKIRKIEFENLDNIKKDNEKIETIIENERKLKKELDEKNKKIETIIKLEKELDEKNKKLEGEILNKKEKYNEELKKIRENELKIRIMKSKIHMLEIEEIMTKKNFWEKIKLEQEKKELDEITHRSQEILKEELIALKTEIKSKRDKIKNNEIKKEALEKKNVVEIKKIRKEILNLYEKERKLSKDLIDAKKDIEGKNIWYLSEINKKEKRSFKL